MGDPNDFVSWDDYLGLNKEAADKTAGEMTQKLDAQGQQLRDQQTNFVNEAGKNGQTPGANAYGSVGGEQNYRDGMMSYGDAVEQLRDPARRQAAMQKQYGTGSALDSALIGAAGGARFDALGKTKNALQNSDTEMTGKVESGFAAGRAQRAMWDTQEARETARRNANHAAQDNYWANQAKEGHDKSLKAFMERNGGEAFDINGTTSVSDSAWDPTKMKNMSNRDYAEQEYAAGNGYTNHGRQADSNSINSKSGGELTYDERKRLAGGDYNHSY